MTDNNFQARLPRSLSLPETWGFGLAGLMLWILAAGDMFAEIGGAQSVLVWLPVMLVGIMGNLQVKHLGTLWPEMAGGTPNYTSRLWRDHPLIARYAVMSYFQGWASVPALSAILLADFIKYHMDALGVSVPLLPLYILLTNISFIVAFSGIRALSILQLFFIVPSVGLIIMFALWGMGWLILDPSSPGIWHGDWQGFSIPLWAKWYFIATYTAYSIETISSFIADSRRPAASLKFLGYVTWLMPIILVGGAWVMMRTMSGQPVNETFPLLNTISSATIFWGEAAPFLMAFLIAAGSLLGCSTGAGNSPRVLYQAALDGHASEVFGASSRYGALFPAMIMTILTATIFLIWQSYFAVFVVTTTGWFASFILMRLGMWLQRGKPEALWPLLSLVIALAEIGIFMLGGMTWGWSVFVSGLLLPVALIGADTLIARVHGGPFTFAWWKTRLTVTEQGTVRRNAIANQVFALIVLAVLITLGAWYIGFITPEQLNFSSGRAMLAVTILLAGFAAVAFSAWTVLLGTKRIEMANEQLRLSAESLQKTTVSRDELAKEVEERKRAEEAVKASEARFRKLFENSNDAIFIHTVDGRILDANSQAENMMGYPVAVLKTMPVPALHPPEELETSKKAFEETISKGATRFESRFRHSGGGLIDVEISARIVDREKGIIQGVARDITEQKKAGEALRSAHEELLKKSGRLEMFQQVAVNREMRMVEMKDEVNGLLERLGEPRKYVEVDSIKKK